MPSHGLLTNSYKDKIQAKYVKAVNIKVDKIEADEIKTKEPISDNSAGVEDYLKWSKGILPSAIDEKFNPDELIAEYRNAQEELKPSLYNKLIVTFAIWRAWHRSPTPEELQYHIDKLEDGTHANAFEMYARVWQSPPALKLHGSIDDNAYMNKVVVITGGSSGMGWSTAVLAAQQGAKKVYCFARTQGVFEWHKESARIGTNDKDRYPLYFGPIDVEQEDLDKIEYKEVDTRNKSRLAEAFAEISSEGYKVDVLVVNAGVNTTVSSFNFPNVETDITKLAKYRWDPNNKEDIFMTNGIGSLNTINEAMQYLSSDANVILISSLWSSNALQAITSGESAYSSTKAMLSRLASGIILGENRKIVVLSPDFVITDMVLAGIFPNLRVPVPQNIKTIDEIRSLFSDVSRDFLLFQLNSPFKENNYFDPTAIYDPEREKLIPSQDQFRLVIAGLSAGYYSHSLKTAYLTSQALTEGLDKTEMLYTNPNYNTFLSFIENQIPILPKEHVDNTLLDLIRPSDVGDIKIPLGNENLREYYLKYRSKYDWVSKYERIGA